MKRILEYYCTKEEENRKIGEYLRNIGYSHAVIVHLKRTQKGILLNGEWAYVNQRLKSGDILTITLIEEEVSENIVPVKMDLDIVYEDEDFMIINKTADMPVHPSVNNFDNTLANGLSYYFRERSEPFVFRCINRLDRDTTGLLIIAKNMLSGAMFSEMVRNRKIHREYLAIAAGKVPAEGVIDAPIARKEESVIERCVDFEKGEKAVTHYKRLEYKNGHSLVSLKLETGRTHQIRVHMKYLGFPLIGDFLYNPDFTMLDHQALHSWKLKFIHPITKKEMEFIQEPPWHLV